jgi:hypothetical protein
VRSATQFDALKRAQTIPCLNNGRPGRVNRVIFAVADDFRSSPGTGHRHGRSACLKSAMNGSHAVLRLMTSAYLEGLLNSAARERLGMGDLNMADMAQGALFILACAFLYGLTVFLFRDQIKRRR